MGTNAKPIAIVAADCHLDSLIWLTRPEIRGDSFHGFRQAKDLAIQHNVDLYLAGDIVECLPTDFPVSETVAFLRNQLQDLMDAGLTVPWIHGQHDDEPSWMFAASGKDYGSDGQIIESGGVRIGMMSYRRTPALPAIMEIMNEKPCDVMICHQIWHELMGGASAQAKIKEFVHPKLVISGDYHQYKAIRLRREDGSKVAAVSPGATHMRKLSEPSHHYVVLLHDDLTIKRLSLNSRARINVSIESGDSFEKFFDEFGTVMESVRQSAAEKQLPTELHTPLLHISDTSDMRDVETRVKAMVGSDAHLFYSKMFASRSTKEVAVDDEIFDNEFDVPLGQYAAEEAGEAKEAAALLAMGFEAAKPKDGIIKWRSQFLSGSEFETVGNQEIASVTEMGQSG